jgi:hypothetical protein
MISDGNQTTTTFTTQMESTGWLAQTAPVEATGD